MSFRELNLSSEVLQALDKMGFEHPTPIQKKVIPIQMEGKDIIAQAQTGTGKTAAFGLPLIEKLIPREYSDGVHSCDALILTPTRELANQVSEEIQRMGEFRKIKTLSIYGGTPIEPQIRALKRKVNVVVATPGRALDHISRRTLNLSAVQCFILDEADEMLDMGFIEDILKIMGRLPPQKQTLLFSATMSPEIEKIAKQYMNNPQFVSVSQQELTIPAIDQFCYQTEEHEKMEVLSRIFDFHKPEMAMVFCQTKREVDELYRKLAERNYQVEALHGDYSQHQRDQVMFKFRNNEIDVLIATDIAARGIDVSNVDMVVNHSVPQNPESYVHRIGRTGRAGRSGTAITLVSSNDYKFLQPIQKLIRNRLKYKEVPSQKELIDIRKKLLQNQIQSGLENSRSADFIDIAASLLEKSTPIEVLASALKLSYERTFPSLRVDEKGKLDAENTGAERGMVRFFISKGKSLFTVRHLLQAITRITDVPGSVVGKIIMQDEFSFVEVPEEWSEHLLKKMSSFTIGETSINLQPARSKSKVTGFHRRENSSQSRNQNARHSVRPSSDYRNRFKKYVNQR